MLFYRCRDLFTGADEDDVFDEVQERFVRKLRDIGYAGCETGEEKMARTWSFLKFSVQETQTVRIRRKGEVLLGEHEPAADEKAEEKEDSFEKQMLLVFLRTCIEELHLERQRELGRLLLAGRELKEVAVEWGAKRQSVWNMFARMKENVRKCIERKRGVL